MKSKVAFILGIYATLFAIGCWEANLARQHAPPSLENLHGYIYTILACITNLFGGLVLCVLALRDLTHDSTTYLGCIVAVWSIVLFAGMVDDSIQTGPFHNVVIAQFAITIGCVFLCCCACISIARFGTTYLRYTPEQLDFYPETQYVQV